MASLELHEKANFTRLSRLLVDKGTEALRITLDALHSPANLPAVLNTKRTSLLKLRPRVINDSQWNLLFPPSGNPPDSKTFDVTLITVLLRNICNLPPPSLGWDTMPPETENTLQANVTRIKLLRNQVYAHVTYTKVDQKRFDDLWQKISQVLLHLKVPKKEINYLKICPLGPEEEIYKQAFKEWVLKDDDCKSMLNDLNKSVKLIEQQMFNSVLQQKSDSQEVKSLKETVEQNRQEIQKLRLSVSKKKKNTLKKQPTHKSAEGEFRENRTNSVDEPFVQKVKKNTSESKISNEAKHFHFRPDSLSNYDGYEIYDDRGNADYVYDHVRELLDSKEVDDYGYDCFDFYDNCIDDDHGGIDYDLGLDDPVHDYFNHVLDFNEEADFY